MKDEIITELWKVKDEIAEETHCDTKVLFQRLRKIQDSSSHPIANRTSLREVKPA